MEVNPGTSAKRPRAKAKDAAAAEGAAAAKKPSTRKKAAVAKSKPAEMPMAAAPLSEATLNGMIATAAYFLAAERDFAPGRELDDWLEAERRIRSQYLS
jgi:hypothetical protein